jgi:hypothetical protein
MTDQLLVRPDAPARPQQREPQRLVSVMGRANRARVDIMGGADRGLRLDIMGGADRGSRLDLMGGPDQSPRVDIMGESDPRFVDSLFIGTHSDRRHATLPRALRHASQVGRVEPTPAPTYAD